MPCKPGGAVDVGGVGGQDRFGIRLDGLGCGEEHLVLGGGGGGARRAGAARGARRPRAPALRARFTGFTNPISGSAARNLRIDRRADRRRHLGSGLEPST